MWWVGLWSRSCFTAAFSVCSMPEQEVVLEAVFKENNIKLMPSAAECHRLIMILHFSKFLMTQLSNFWHMVSKNNKGLTPGKDWRIQMVKKTVNKNYCHNLFVFYCLNISYCHKIINPTLWFYFSFAEIWTTILTPRSRTGGRNEATVKGDFLILDEYKKVCSSKGSTVLYRLSKPLS